jgi:CHAP domain
VSLPDVLTRISELQGLLNPQPAAPASGAASSTTVTNPSAFASQLQSATTGPAAAGLATSPLGGLTGLSTPAPVSGGGTAAGQAIVNLARQEVGVQEEPPGSNNGARISQYRQATAGSGVGPWCAYFTSWAARSSGVPLGDSGQGFGRVDDVYAWAQRTGKAIPAGSGQPPQPGDLIVWDEHIGIVESVDTDGSIHTIEGNSSDSVARRDYGSDGGGAIGFVRLG